MHLRCSFFQTKINYLRHVIANNKISLDPERISAIIFLPPTNNVKSLHSFIGMTQFCSRFVHNLNTILTPLYELLKGGNSSDWSK